VGKLVSVVIPTYNRANIITDAVNTVLKQTYQNFEILIIDDGSTDNTENIIKEIQDQRIKYIYQENNGPAKARNNGIKHSKGEYIVFLDSDDLWHPELLEKHIKILNANSNIGMVSNHSLYKTFDGQYIRKKTCQAKNNKEYLRYILTEPDKAYPGPSTTMFKRECFEKVGYFDETLDFCEDWDMCFRVALFYEFHCINETLTYVRVHQNSLSRTREVEKFRNSYLKFLQKAFENTSLLQEALYNFVSNKHTLFSCLIKCKLLNIKNKAYSNALWSIGSWALYKSRDSFVARKNLMESLKYSHTKIFNLKFLIALLFSYSPLFMLNVYQKLKKGSGKAY